MTGKLTLPSAEENALAREVNTKLPPHMHVTPYRIDNGDDGIGYGMVFEYWHARRPVERAYPFFDADELVKDIFAWAEELRAMAADAWTIAH